MLFVDALAKTKGIAVIQNKFIREGHRSRAYRAMGRDPLIVGKSNAGRGKWHSFFVII
jgi:hypothetical protein